jgi:hypothetical protein
MTATTPAETTWEAQERRALAAHGLRPSGARICPASSRVSTA